MQGRALFDRQTAQDRIALFKVRPPDELSGVGPRDIVIAALWVDLGCRVDACLGPGRRVEPGTVPAVRFFRTFKSAGPPLLRLDFLCPRRTYLSVQCG